MHAASAVDIPIARGGTARGHPEAAQRMQRNGCNRWAQRFGLAPMRLNMAPSFRARHLRGIYLRVVEDGPCAGGDQWVTGWSSSPGAEHVAVSLSSTPMVASGVSSWAPKLATYADLLSLPDDVRAEIMGGKVVTAPAPLPKHAKAQGAIRSFIGRPFDDDDGHGGPGGWWIFVEVDVQLGPHDVVRPDLSGWRRERFSDPAERRPIDVTPDWVCEVLSPSTATRDKVAKRRLYAECGIPHYWIVDVDARTLEAFELNAGRWVLVGSYDDQAKARVPPFDAVEVSIGRFFLPVIARG